MCLTPSQLVFVMTPQGFLGTHRTETALRDFWGVPISMLSGVQRGDPLAPLLHALALQPFLLACDANVPEADILVVHDNLTTSGSPEATRDFNRRKKFVLRPFQAEPNDPNASTMPIALWCARVCHLWPF